MLRGRVSGSCPPDTQRVLPWMLALVPNAFAILASLRRRPRLLSWRSHESCSPCLVTVLRARTRSLDLASHAAHSSTAGRMLRWAASRAARGKESRELNAVRPHRSWLTPWTCVYRRAGRGGVRADRLEAGAESEPRRFGIVPRCGPATPSVAWRSSQATHPRTGLRRVGKGGTPANAPDIREVRCIHERPVT
jgi:hypothetical protein